MTTWQRTHFRRNQYYIDEKQTNNVNISFNLTSINNRIQEIFQVKKISHNQGVKKPLRPLKWIKEKKKINTAFMNHLLDSLPVIWRAKIVHLQVEALHESI